MTDWDLVRQQNKTQTNKDNIRKYLKIVDHHDKVRDKVMKRHVRTH